MSVTASVLVNGIEYRKNLFVILEKPSGRVDGLVLFGHIGEIVLLEGASGRVFLLTSVCTTLISDVYVNAYQIDVNSLEVESKFIEPLQLACYIPYPAWKKPTSDELYISLRHIIE
ncbi:hypothetical protein QAD02_011707 [Eretmocerus hayati]|uniref:Uncharacterized protein n=1 Tax=Eretmocerus hayati TaxID=131215 RepID=A0ACC2NXP0_9HYME|nr:hypothetical protein QAD02_011707 [Eretmocerus hayati]